MPSLSSAEKAFERFGHHLNKGTPGAILHFISEVARYAYQAINELRKIVAKKFQRCELKRY